jgi:molybdopterin-guanine dinucleotide biosynthesis protein A
MGRDKATLPFGPECMLQRVIRLISETVPLQRIVVVATLDQALPAIPPEVKIAYDAHPDRGPLEGFASGLQAVEKGVEAAYVTSCDVPLLVSGFVERMFDLLGDADAVIPEVDSYLYPLNAIYRTSVLKKIRRLLEANRLSVSALFDKVPSRKISSEKIREFDAELASLRNVNCQDDYLAALEDAGFDKESYRW